LAIKLHWWKLIVIPQKVAEKIVLINGVPHEILVQGTESIANGMWLTVKGFSMPVLAIDEARYYADDVKPENKSKRIQPFWSKQGKNKKGGRRKY